MATHRMFDTGDSAADSSACDLAEMAAYIFPEAVGADLDLGFDLIGWLYFFDDLVDGLPGERPRETAALTDHFASVIHGARPDIACPGATALADLWRRQRSGMSPSWQVRAAHNWETYLCSHPQEAIDRYRGDSMDRATYVEVRARTSGSDVVLDMTERLTHCEVPPVAFHCLPLHLMRRIAVDIANLCNDIHSADRESSLHDPHNLVLIVQSDQHCSREQAVKTVHGLISDMAAQFKALSSDAHASCDLMALTEREHQAVSRYIRAMELFMRGYDEWGRTSSRYTDTSFTPPWQAPEITVEEPTKSA